MLLVSHQTSVPALIATFNIEWNDLREAVYSGPIMSDISDTVGLAFRSAWGGVLGVDPSFVFLSEVSEYFPKKSFQFTDTSSVNVFGRPMNLNTTLKLILSLDLIDKQSASLAIESDVGETETDVATETRRRYLADKIGGSSALPVAPFKEWGGGSFALPYVSGISTERAAAFFGASRSLKLDFPSKFTSFSSTMTGGVGIVFLVLFPNITSANNALVVLRRQSNTQLNATLSVCISAIANQMNSRHGRSLAVVVNLMNVLGASFNPSSAEVVILTYTFKFWGLFLEWLRRHIARVLAGSLCMIMVILFLSSWNIVKTYLSARAQRLKCERALMARTLFIRQHHLSFLRARLRAPFRRMARFLAQNKGKEKITANALLLAAQGHQVDTLFIKNESVNFYDRVRATEKHQNSYHLLTLDSPLGENPVANVAEAGVSAAVILADAHAMVEIPRLRGLHLPRFGLITPPVMSHISNPYRFLTADDLAAHELVSSNAHAQARVMQEVAEISALCKRDSMMPATMPGVLKGNGDDALFDALITTLNQRATGVLTNKTILCAKMGSVLGAIRCFDVAAEYSVSLSTDVTAFRSVDSISNRLLQFDDKIHSSLGEESGLSPQSSVSFLPHQPETQSLARVARIASLPHFATKAVVISPRLLKSPYHPVRLV